MPDFKTVADAGTKEKNGDRIKEIFAKAIPDAKNLELYASNFVDRLEICREKSKVLTQNSMEDMGFVLGGEFQVKKIKTYVAGLLSVKERDQQGRALATRLGRLALD